MDVALQKMERHEEVRRLLAGMLHRELTLDQAGEAIELAAQKGVLKVQIVFPEGS